MPRFEVNQYGNDQELLFKPSPGDLRYKDFGTLERFDPNGQWTYVGDLDLLFNSVITLQMENAELKEWMRQEKWKDNEQIIADKLEDEFNDLEEAGLYLRDLEKMLRVARKTYNSMIEETKEKVKTFERLDTPYPENKTTTV